MRRSGVVLVAGLRVGTGESQTLSRRGAVRMSITKCTLASAFGAVALTQVAI